LKQLRSSIYILVYGRETNDLESNCLVTTPSGTQYNFKEAYQQQSVTIIDIPFFNDLLSFSFFLNFCDSVYSVIGNYSNIDPIQYEGWFFGTITSFIFNEDFENPKFFQTYSNGDRGYPCLTGRTALVTISCTGCPPQTSCYGNYSTEYCICLSTYDYQNKPCELILSISMTCPQPFSPNPATPTPTNEISPGSVFGIVILILLILGAIAFVGTYIYNQKVIGKRGADAIPGIEYYRKIVSGNCSPSGTEYTTSRSKGGNTYGTL